MRHFCCRCGKGFIVYNEGEYQSVEECVYHFGRLIKSKGIVPDCIIIDRLELCVFYF